MSLDYRYGDDEPDVMEVPRPTARRRLPATETLARLAVEEALRPHRRTLRRSGGLAVVVEVPSAAWVEPVAEACQAISSFDAVYDRTGTSRTEHRPDKGAAAAAEKLSRGERVLGVAPSAALHLPSSLVASADVAVHVREPSAALLAKVLKAATGRSGRVPNDAAAGLDYDDLVASVRVGEAPGRALARLAAAREARSGGDIGADVAPFASLRGYGEAHAFGKALIDAARRYRTGEPIRNLSGRACLLASEPGLGKTTYVRSLAKASGLQLVATSVAQWFTGSNGYLDGVLRAIDATFVLGRDCLIFLDELDALPNRAEMDGRNRDFYTPVVTNVLLKVETALAQSDAFVAVIGATNHPGRVDGALLRPGRLDRVIRIREPDVEDLAAILRQHLGSDLPGEDLSGVAHLAAGSTGARVAMVARDARARAASEGRPVRMQDLVDALAPPAFADPRFLRRACLHEAGHAVIGERHDPGGLAAVSVVPDTAAGAGGTTVRRTRPAKLALRSEIEADVVVLLAGRAAEIVFLGEASSGSGGDATSDLARATITVARVHGNLGLADRLAFAGDDRDLFRAMSFDRDLGRDVEADLRRLMDEAVGAVERDRDMVEAVATALADRRALSGDVVRAILAGAGTGP